MPWKLLTHGRLQRLALQLGTIVYLFQMISLVSLFNGISILVGYLIVKKPECCYLSHSWENKGVHAFIQGTSPKVDEIAWPKFQLTLML